MIYKFKSSAAGDVVMLEESGHQLLRLLGREPSARGIFDWEQMPALMQTLEQVVLAEEAARERAEREAALEGRRIKPPEVTLRQRVWPMREMMRRSHAEQAPIVWGV